MKSSNATGVRPPEHLSRSGFFRLWGGEATSLCGSQISALALPLIALNVLDASKTQMTLVALSESVAVLAFGLIAGVVADRNDGVAVMLWSNLARLALVAVIPILYAIGVLQLWTIFVVLIAGAGFNLLFDSALSRYIPALVPNDSLMRANAWMQSTQATGEVGGPTLAGVIVAAVGAPIAMVVDAISYTVSCFTLRTLPRHHSPEDHDEEESARSAIAKGFVNVWRVPALRLTTLGAAHFNLFSSLFFALYLLFLVRELHYSPVVVGLVYTTGGIGGLAGAAITEQVIRVLGNRNALALTLSLPGICALLLPLSRNSAGGVVAVVVFAAAFVWSVCVVINVTVCETLKQTLVPSREIGRTTSAVRFISWGIEIVGAGSAAALVAIGANTTTVLAVGAVGVALSGIWIAGLGPVSNEGDSPVAEKPEQHINQ